MTNHAHVPSETGVPHHGRVPISDQGIARISRRLAGELVFDEIGHLPKKQEEHDMFKGVLTHFVDSLTTGLITNLDPVMSCREREEPHFMTCTFLRS